MCTRECKRHHHTTPTACRRGGALYHGTIDDPRRYERQQAPNTRNDSIDRAYPRREEAPLQPAASMASSRERPPHLTSAASATRHATKIGTPADETSDEGERRVTSVRPIASNTARAKVLRDGMHARRHNKRRESVTDRLADKPKSGRGDIYTHTALIAARTGAVASAAAIGASQARQPAHKLTAWRLAHGPRGRAPKKAAPAGGHFLVHTQVDCEREPYLLRRCTSDDF